MASPIHDFRRRRVEMPAGTKSIINTIKRVPDMFIPETSNEGRKRRKEIRGFAIVVVAKSCTISAVPRVTIMEAINPDLLWISVKEHMKEQKIHPTANRQRAVMKM
jgi:hypothetical protein